MVKVVNPAHSIDCRGRIDSVVFAANQGGNYARRHTIQSSTGSTSQQNHRSLLAAASGAYCDLSPSDRSTWFKPPYFNIRTLQRPGKCMLRGYHYHNHVWIILKKLGAATIKRAYVGPAPVTPSTLTLTRVGSSIHISWTTPTQPHPGRTHIQIWRFGPVPIGNKPDPTHAKWIASPLMSNKPYIYTISRPGRYYFWIRCIDGLSGWTTGFIKNHIDIISL